MDSAPSVDDQVTVRLPTHGIVASPLGQNATNGVSSGIEAMVVDDGAQGGVLTPPQSKSDMDTVFGKPQYSQFRGRKVDSSDEDCGPDKFTYYGNGDTDSETEYFSSLEGESPKDDSWRSTIMSRSCDTIDSLDSGIGLHSGDLFNSEGIDDQQKQTRPVPAPRFRKLSVPSLPVAAPRIRKLAVSESPLPAPRVRGSVDRDNFQEVELQSAGRSESIRPRRQDILSQDHLTSDKYGSQDRKISHVEGFRSSRKNEVSRRRRSYSSDDRRLHRRPKYSEKRHHRCHSSSSPDDYSPVVRRRCESSVTFPDDKCTRKVVSRSHKDSMKVERYDGSTSFEVFMVQFENCAKYNGWDTDDKLLQLKGALRGPAAQLLLVEGDATTFQELCQVLRQCFGTEGCEYQFEFQLKMRRRYHEETLRSLYQDINRLVLQAYPGSQSKLRDRLAVEAFITSLNDKDLELRVRDRCPANLLDCFRTAMMLESNQLIVQRDDNTCEKRRLMEDTDVHVRAIYSGESEELLQSSQEYYTANAVTSDKSAVADRYIKELEERYRKCKEEKLALSENLSRNNPSQRTETAGQWKEQSFGPRPRRPINCFRCDRPGHRMKFCRPKIGPTRKCEQLEHSQSSEYPSEYQVRVAKLVAQSDAEEKPDLRRHEYLDMKLNGRNQRFLLDFGCEDTLFPASCVRPCQIKPTDRKFKAADGTEIALLGEVEVTLQIEHLKIPTFALVTETVVEPVLGYDWLARNKVFWNFGVGKIIIQSEIFSLGKCKGVEGSKVLLNKEISGEIKRCSLAPASTVHSLTAPDSPELEECMRFAARMLSPPDSKGLSDDNQTEIMEGLQERMDSQMSITPEQFCDDTGRRVKGEECMKDHFTDRRGSIPRIKKVISYDRDTFVKELLPEQSLDCQIRKNDHMEKLWKVRKKD